MSYLYKSWKENM